MNEPIYRLLGLCMKAGRLLSGSEQIKTAVGLERSLKRPVSRDVYDAIKEKIGNE